MNSLIIRRFVELQKWRNLRVSLQNVSAFSNSFSSASDADVSLRDGLKGNKFKVSCLVDSLGLASNRTTSVSSEVSFTDKENKIRNIFVLRELGVPPKRLLSLLISKSQPVCGTERFDASLKKVVEMGFDPTTLMFLQALHMLHQMSDKTIEEKVEVYRSVGFTVDDVWAIFKKWPCSLTHSEKKVANSMETFFSLGFSRDDFVRMVKRFPQCIGLSAELVKKKTEFLVKKMNWPLKAVVSNPTVLGYSLEKRTVPRCNVIKALMLKGLLGDGGSELPPMMSVLAITDKAFLNRYVMKHDDKQLVPELMAILLADQKARLEQ